MDDALRRRLVAVAVIGAAAFVIFNAVDAVETYAAIERYGMVEQNPLVRSIMVNHGYFAALAFKAAGVLAVLVVCYLFFNAFPRSVAAIMVSGGFFYFAGSIGNLYAYLTGEVSTTIGGSGGNFIDSFINPVYLLVNISAFLLFALPLMAVRRDFRAHGTEREAEEARLRKLRATGETDEQ